MKRRSQIALILMAISTWGCIPNTEAPATTIFTCERDADCPSGQICQVLAQACATEQDTVPPRLVGVTTLSATTLEVAFNEEMFEGDLNAIESFDIDPPLIIESAAARASLNGTILVTEPQTGGVTYTLNAANARDGSGNPTQPGFDTADFVGFGVPPDTVPPVVLQPAQNTVVENLEALVIWTQRAGAASYSVEVATDALFANIVVSDEVLHPSTSLQLTNLEAVSYYVRVRANVTAVGEYGETNFDAVGDTIYVYCPSGEDCSTPPSNVIQLGSRTNPFWKPSAAVTRAVALGAVRVNIASRDSSGLEPYEDVLFVGAPLEVFGGYEPSFDETTRNPQLNPTVLTFVGDVLRVESITEPARVDGLRLITSPGTGALVSITGCNEQVLLSNLELIGDYPLVGQSVTATSNLGQGPRIEDSSIVTRSPNASGVLLEQGPLQLTRVTIESDAVGGNGAFGIQSRGTGASASGNVFVTDSTIRVFSGSSVGIEFGEGGAGEIRGTTVDVGPGDGQAIAFYRNALAMVTHLPVLIEDCVAVIRTMPSQQSSFGFQGQETTDITIRNTRFDIGGADMTAVINLDEVSDVLIEGSLLQAGPSNDNAPSAGVRASGGDNLTLRDSIVWNYGLGEHEGVSIAVGTTLPTNVRIVGNTIAIPPEPADTMMQDFTNYGIVPQVPVIVSNNILVDYGTDNICVLANPMTASLRNNAFVGCATLVSHDGAPFTDAASVNGLNGAQVADGVCDPLTAMDCETARVSGNVFTTQSLDEVFTDFDGPDNDPATTGDNDLTLLLVSDPQNIRGGGHDPVEMACGTQETTVSCGGSLMDYRGSARTSPFSMGAFESP